MWIAPPMLELARFYTFFNVFGNLAPLVQATVPVS